MSIVVVSTVVPEDAVEFVDAVLLFEFDGIVVVPYWLSIWEIT